jgi:hypothetical protein
MAYMYILNYDKWYFVSFDPRVKENKRKMFIFTIHRNNDDIMLLIKRLLQANEIKLNILENL